MTLRNLLIILFGCMTSFLVAQEKDAGLWTGIGLSYEVNKKLELSVSPEIRMEENISRTGSVFCDFGAEYKLGKGFFATATYRGGAKNRIDYFQTRQRLQLGLGYKWKYEDFSISYALRYQGSIQGGLSGDSDADFITIIRNKVGVKYEGVKKYTFSMSYEFFNSAAAVNRLEWQNWRWIAEAERKLNKRNFVSVGYLIQKNLVSSVPSSDFVVLVGYKHIFKKKKD
jgi:hypothetical protein